MINELDSKLEELASLRRISDNIEELKKKLEGQMVKKNELTWLETEYFRNDITFQPVLVNGELWYTVFDNHGYTMLFDTFLGLYEYLKDGKHEEGNCFEDEDDMIKYLEEV